MLVLEIIGELELHPADCRRSWVQVQVQDQAILGSLPCAPADLLRSNEAEVYPKNRPERADLIDGCIGEGSPFHDTFGYYAQGVGRTTAVLPAGWDTRLVAICNPNTRGAIGWCLELHDLLLSKAVAGREKDLAYLATAAAHGLARPALLLERLLTLPVPEPVRELVRARLRQAFG